MRAGSLGAEQTPRVALASIRPASQRIMCNEDNTEQLSSHAQVPCPTATVRKCRHLPTAHRSQPTWTLTGTNCVVYEPPVEDILARYYQKVNKGGRLDVIEEYHAGLRDGRCSHNEGDSQRPHFLLATVRRPHQIVALCWRPPPCYHASCERAWPKWGPASRPRRASLNEHSS